MRLRRALIWVVGAGIAGACAGGPSQAPASSIDVTGEWRWLWAFGGPRKDTTTFGGDAALLELDSAGRYRLTAASLPPSEGTYRIDGRGEARITQEIGTKISFSPPAPFLQDPEMVLIVHADTLFLRTLAYDEFDYAFVRVR